MSNPPVIELPITVKFRFKKNSNREGSATKICEIIWVELESRGYQVEDILFGPDQDSYLEGEVVD